MEGASKEPLPSTSRVDEVDIMQITKANPQVKLLKELVKLPLLGVNDEAGKVMNDIHVAEAVCKDLEIATEDLCEMYLRFNRLRQEQNHFRKLRGPNYLEEILAKPKTRIQDANDELIDPIDFAGFTVDPENQDEPEWDEPVFKCQRGTFKAGSSHIIRADLESFDYTEPSTALRYKAWKDATARKNLFTNFNRWPIAFAIGFVTACIAVTIQVSIKELTNWKYHILSTWFQKTYEDKDQIVSYLISASFNIVACFLAALCCVMAPEAVGSGIPQIKSYLNGVNVPRLMRFRTLVGKVVGVIMSVAGGLPVGKEGPMIHSGAVVGAGLSQGKSTTLPITTKYNKVYRNDLEKRDFVACGAAAGVAAAFGAPLGGLLFAIEEGASHINHSTLWRIAMSSVTSYFTLNIINSAIRGIPGQMSNGGLINFGEFDNAEYNFYQLIVFLLMGCIGGLLGALFNYLNMHITKFRLRFINSNASKICEAILCGITATSIAFTMMLKIDDCREYDVDMNDAPVRLFCQDGKASAAAGLWYKTPEETVKSLFHDSEGAHNYTTLLCFAICYFFLACWTYGMYISSGLFVPSLLIGASWGRLVGMTLYHTWPASNWGDLGKYALVGAAAQLSGTVRLTYSLTAIVLEATGNLTYCFPIFVTVFIAKCLGDFFGEGIYEIHIDLQGIPLLQYQPKIELKTVIAKDMMNTNVRCLKVRMKCKDVLEIIRQDSHNAYPIVDTDIKVNSDGTKTFGRMRGTIKYHEIITLLYHQIYVETGRFGSEYYEMMRSKYPRFIQLGEFVIPENFQQYSLDFSNAMNSAPYTAYPSMSYTAVYNLFRTMGMRHLVVVNSDNEVVGMITRKEVAGLDPQRRFWTNTISLKKKTLMNTHFRTPNEEINDIGRRRRLSQYNRLID